MMRHFSVIGRPPTFADTIARSPCLNRPEGEEPNQPLSRSLPSAVGFQDRALKETYSDYVFYGDESGDHSLASVDPSYPIFALALCGFRKKTYSRRIVPSFQDLKFRYFGHDTVVLHERDIRKQLGYFQIFVDAGLRENFIEDINGLIASASFHVIATVIDKRMLREDLIPEHPYNISLKFCLQSAYLFLVRKRQGDRVTYFIFERRGAKEDNELELEFRRITQGVNDLRVPFPGFRIIFSDKKSNSTGMQIADLIARPIGLKVLRPDQENRAYEIIKRKLFGKRARSASRRGIHLM